MLYCFQYFHYKISELLEIIRQALSSFLGQDLVMHYGEEVGLS